MAAGAAIAPPLYVRGHEMRPPAICTSCLADLPASPCPCGRPRVEVVWTPFPSGFGPLFLRVVFGSFITALGAGLVAGAVFLCLEAPEISLAMLGRVMGAVVLLTTGAFMLGVANAFWFGRRWDYRSPDGLTSGWVMRMFGNTFEASGEHGTSVVLPAPPASDVDSGALALPSCDTATGLVLTMLGLAARGSVVLRQVERRPLVRPPNWPLSLGWWWARTSPRDGGPASRVEIAAVASSDDRRLEGALLAALPKPIDAGAEAQPDHYRAPPRRGEPGKFVPLAQALFDWMLAVGGSGAAREDATSDAAPTRLAGVAEAERALAASRTMAPAILEEIERAAGNAQDCCEVHGFHG